MDRRPPPESAVVPAIGTAGSLTAIRSLGRAGVHTVAVSEQDHPPSFSSRYCGETRSVPSPTADVTGYRDALLDLARREDVRAILPMREADVYALASERAAFADHVTPLWPTAETLSTVHDRLALYAAAERAGVAVPETTLLDEIDRWDRERIVKGRHAILTAETADVPTGTLGSPPKTIFLAPGEAPDVAAIVGRMGHVPIAQSYLEGTEFCFRALYDRGEAVMTSQKRLVRGIKYARGPSVCHAAVDLPGLEAAGRALLDALEWHGMASVGFIRDETGAFRLLEVNPRFPASIPVDVHAGRDYPVACWRLATGRDPAASEPYRPGTVSHTLRGEAVHLHSVLTEEYPLADRPAALATIWAIARSVLAQPNFDYLSREDPRPFVRDVIGTARSVRSA